MAWDENVSYQNNIIWDCSCSANSVFFSFYEAIYVFKIKVIEVFIYFKGVDNYFD